MSLLTCRPWTLEHLTGDCLSLGDAVNGVGKAGIVAVAEGKRRRPTFVNATFAGLNGTALNAGPLV